ncbi:MAG: acetyl-CoA carboxylase biotin carboxyl carrier protein subunit [candidate division KSB1 bacterium]|nr:acetyl-CoA carboxylase biotin carboxyl carrier protein subunit [candidate division KSB1 bacterium]
MRYLVRFGDQKLSISDIDREKGQARVDGKLVQFDFQHVRGPVYSLIVEGKVFSVSIENNEGITEVSWGANILRAEVEDERAALLRQLSRRGSQVSEAIDIKAPMPGLVIRVPVKTGDTIKKGQSLAVIEAMKMENDIRSPMDGVVSAIHIRERSAVEKNALLVTLTPRP